MLESAQPLPNISFVPERNARSVKPKNANLKPYRLIGLNNTDSRLTDSLWVPFIESFLNPENPLSVVNFRNSFVYLLKPLVY